MKYKSRYQNPVLRGFPVRVGLCCHGISVLSGPSVALLSQPVYSPSVWLVAQSVVFSLTTARSQEYPLSVTAGSLPVVFLILPFQQIVFPILVTFVTLSHFPPKFIIGFGIIMTKYTFSKKKKTILYSLEDQPALTFNKQQSF